jgi:hypothetical protein
MTPIKNAGHHWIIDHLESGDFEDLRDYFNHCDLEQLAELGLHLRIVMRAYDKHCTDLQNQVKEEEMERIRYVGKISKQGNKRMVIIPTEYHDKVTRIGDRQVHVDISLAYDDEDMEPSKKSKK